MSKLNSSCLLLDASWLVAKAHKTSLPQAVAWMRDHFKIPLRSFTNAVLPGAIRTTLQQFSLLVTQHLRTDYIWGLYMSITLPVHSLAALCTVHDETLLDPLRSRTQLSQISTPSYLQYMFSRTFKQLHMYDLTVISTEYFHRVRNNRQLQGR